MSADNTTALLALPNTSLTSTPILTSTTTPFPTHSQDFATWFAPWLGVMAAWVLFCACMAVRREKAFHNLVEPQAETQQEIGVTPRVSPKPLAPTSPRERFMSSVMTSSVMPRVLSPTVDGAESQVLSPIPVEAQATVALPFSPRPWNPHSPIAKVLPPESPV
jgi:hypothetical protein